MAWRINAPTIHATVRPHCTVCVCVNQNFKGLCQGCVIPFKETESVKTALPQKLGERGTHSHIKWKGNIYGAWAHSLPHFSLSVLPSCPCPLSYVYKHTHPTQYTQPLALKHIPTALILILLVSFCWTCSVCWRLAAPHADLWAWRHIGLSVNWGQLLSVSWAQLVLYRVIQTGGVMG